ncbi:MAG: hypothetical protein JEZ00_19620 [Anaerolineaceae bacterium]|nr:hypothetical protein [Anaerolineaceae bacterium]
MKKKKSYRKTFLLIIALTFLLAACTPAGYQTCLESGEAFPEAAEGEDYVDFTVENNTCMSICEILVSPDNCEYMGGVDWVEDHPLRSEASVTQQIPQGKYAVWVELCTDEFRADERIKVFSDATHVVVDPARGGKPPCGTSLIVINNATVPICKLWISNSGSIYDSRNWIGSEQIQPDETLELMLRPDTYDIRADDCDGNSLRFDGDMPISGHLDWMVP